MRARSTLVRVARHALGRGDDTLTAVGLGSCVAVILHDEAAQIGGMAHVLLPDANAAQNTSNPFKFATLAVPSLLEALQSAGGSPDRVVARLVGGATMFSSLLSPSMLSMGERNVTAARQALHASGVPVRGEDVGGEYGRAVHFDICSGAVRITSIARDDIIL